ncbi:MAG: hypothetical protein Q9159_004272 [Coniocarpon cinnabarinum]
MSRRSSRYEKREYDRYEEDSVASHDSRDHDARDHDAISVRSRRSQDFSNSRRSQEYSNTRGQDYSSNNRSLARVQPQYSQSLVKKRLVVYCDGTWVNANSVAHHGKIEPPSNVSRFTRAVRSSTTSGIPQIVYYQAGIGSIGGDANKIIGGAIGEGIGENVREAYSFIANNYNVGDEIFLLGFSRGAFTARSVGGLIASIGVLTKAGLSAFPVIYKDFQHRFERGYQSPAPDLPFPNKPPARSPEYGAELEHRHLTTLNVRIKAIGVWDTVGSLGVPRVQWLGNFGKRANTEASEYKFYDTGLSECVDNAFQALALDEQRANFQPAVWEKRSNTRTNLIQVWFPGVHANVGGGYNDQELANISLAWMMAMMDPLLELNQEYILTEEKNNAAYYDSKGTTPRPWSFGKIYASDSGAFKAAGKVTRTPGDYFRLEPETGAETRKPLKNTNEYVHSSVRARFVMEGPGRGGKGIYTPPALKGWHLDAQEGLDLPTPWYWEREGEGRERIILPEAPLRRIERMLLETSPQVGDVVDEPPAPKKRR